MVDPSWMNHTVLHKKVIIIAIKVHIVSAIEKVGCICNASFILIFMENIHVQEV